MVPFSLGVRFSLILFVISDSVGYRPRNCLPWSETQCFIANIKSNFSFVETFVESQKWLSNGQPLSSSSKTLCASLMTLVLRLSFLLFPFFLLFSHDFSSHL